MILIEYILRQDRHHRQSLLKGSGFGGLVGVLGCEEEKEPLWLRGILCGLEGGECDAEVSTRRRVEGGVEDVDCFYLRRCR